MARKSRSTPPVGGVADVFAGAGRRGRRGRPTAVRGNSGAVPQPPLNGGAQAGAPMPPVAVQLLTTPDSPPSTGPIPQQHPLPEVDAAAAEGPETASRRRKRSKKRDDDPHEAKVAFAAAVGGARGLQLTFRWFAFLALALIVALGVRELFWPTASPSGTQVQGGETSSAKSFPSEAAEGYAIAFAQAYFTWNAEDTAARAAALDPFLPASLQDGWDGKGQQAIVVGPLVASSTTVHSQTLATVHLQLMTDKGEWLYVAVLVEASSPSEMVIASLPAPEPAPQKGGYSGSDLGEIDSIASDAVAVDMPGFFAAWATSSTAELDRYLSPGATSAAKNGLHGQLILVEVADVKVAADGGEERAALVEVVWSVGGLDDPTAATLTTTYHLTLRQIDDRWYVLDLTAGQPETDPEDAPEDDPSPSPTPGG